MNTIMLSDVRLTRDPEVRNLPNGGSVCSITVVDNETWKNKEGERQEISTFVDCDIFGPRADVVAKYFKKGNRITLVGKLRQDKWEDKEGQKRSKLFIRVDDFGFVDPPSEGNGDSDNGEATAKPARPANAKRQPQRETVPMEGSDDDIPF
jgi:single-strand DNA-binding protein